jgi:hemoglobin
MRNIVRTWQLLVAASIVSLALAIPLSAQEKPASAPVSSKVLDHQVSDMLSVIVNTGAEVHNGVRQRGIRPNPAGCYRLYHDFLAALRPLLADHPDLQTAIDTGLTKAEQMPAGTIGNDSERAFVLRGVIDTIQATVGPRRAQALWIRLGGEANVRKIVDDFVALAAKDAKVNFFRGTALKDKVDVPVLKRRLVELISVVTGGPYVYSGRSMKEVHKGMHITGPEFDALVSDLAEALAKNGAKPADIDAVVTAVNATRKEIVEAKEAAKVATLWEQLGGERNVKQVVADWVALAGPDPKVNFDRGGKVKLSNAQVAQLTDGLVAYLSKLTGGPLKYQGKSMKEVHRGMGITNAEFDAALADLRKALQGRGVDALVIQDVLKLVEGTRGDIVEIKGPPEQNKLEEKKQGKKKSDG